MPFRKIKLMDSNQKNQLWNRYMQFLEERGTAIGERLEPKEHYRRVNTWYNTADSNGDLPSLRELASLKMAYRSFDFPPDVFRSVDKVTYLHQQLPQHTESSMGPPTNRTLRRSSRQRPDTNPLSRRPTDNRQAPQPIRPTYGNATSIRDALPSE
jgi:hypothetical protein